MCEPHAVHNMSVVSQGLVINKIYFFICHMKALLRFILYIRETSVVTCIYLICSNNKVTLYVRVWIETYLEQ